MDNLTPPKRKRTQHDYNMGFKLAVVSCVEKGELTYKQAQRYLSLVTDACSRKIMGHELSHEMKASDILIALQKAVSHRKTDAPLIHHSDRGLQYCSAIYQSELAEHDIKPSMTDGYDCYQNALAERVNGILKQEFLFNRCQTFEDLKVLVAESIGAYNQLRPHLSLGMKTPEEVHKKACCEMQQAQLKTVNVF